MSWQARGLQSRGGGGALTPHACWTSGVAGNPLWDWQWPHGKLGKALMGKGRARPQMVLEGREGSPQASSNW